MEYDTGSDNTESASDSRGDDMDSLDRWRRVSAEKDDGGRGAGGNSECGEGDTVEEDGNEVRGGDDDGHDVRGDAERGGGRDMINRTQ